MKLSGFTKALWRVTFVVLFGATCVASYIQHRLSWTSWEEAERLYQWAAAQGSSGGNAMGDAKDLMINFGLFRPLIWPSWVLILFLLATIAYMAATRKRTMARPKSENTTTSTGGNRERNIEPVVGDNE